MTKRVAYTTPPRRLVATERVELPKKTPGQAKYNAEGLRLDGHYFGSRAEAERYLQLLELVTAEVIENLELQPSFDLVVRNVRICRYRADFRYDVAGPPGRPLRTVIEDVKGIVTPEFRLKHKLFDALQPIKVSVIELAGECNEAKNGSLILSLAGPLRSRRPGSGAGWLARHWRGRIPDPN